MTWSHAGLISVLESMVMITLPHNNTVTCPVEWGWNIKSSQWKSYLQTHYNVISNCHHCTTGPKPVTCWMQLQHSCDNDLWLPFIVPLALDKLETLKHQSLAGKEATKQIILPITRSSYLTLSVKKVYYYVGTPIEIFRAWSIQPYWNENEIMILPSKTMGAWQQPYIRVQHSATLHTDDK